MTLKPDPTAVADYIHASKYARYLPELQRRELYDETVARVELMHMKRFPELRQEIAAAFDLVREKKVLPSMRSMQFGGIAIESNNSRQYNCSSTLVDRPRVFAEAMYLLLCGCGVGYSIQHEHVEKLPELAYLDNTKVVHHVVQDSIEGWSDALDALINAYISGYLVEFSYHKIRSAGTALKTSGGRAPGHRKLRKSLERIRAVLHGAQGRQLRPIECHRIMCHAADAVLSGGIRRSAMIALFSYEDSEMMNCKADPDWYNREPWLQNANNSVVFVHGEVQEKQFRRLFQFTRKFGEPGFVFVNSPGHVYNPCQPEWATVLTTEGIRTFKDIDVGSMIWSGRQWTKVTKKWCTGDKQVNGYHTRAGVFYGTENHRVIQDGERCEVKDADTIDVCVGGAEGGTFDPQSIMDGLLIGDGTVHQASNQAIWLLIGQDDGDYHQSEVAPLLGMSREAAHDYAWEVTTTLRPQELPHTYARQIPDRFRFGDEATVRSFLRGLYSANGSIVRDRVTLKAASRDVIIGVQQMLSSLGIGSYYTVNAPAEINHSNGTHTSRQSYDLNITSGRQQFRKLIGFIQKHKQDRLDEACLTHGKARKQSYEITNVESFGVMPVYDITVEAEEHTYWTGGLLVSNCSEVGMDPTLACDDGTLKTGWSMCNLTEINAAKLTSLEDFKAAATAAATIGTLQAAYTSFPYLGEITEKIVQRDALIGVGMTGMQDSPKIALNSEFQRIVAGVVVQVNAEVAAKLGIRRAARCTVVKPAGTTSLALGSVGSGIHPHHAKKYIRRVTADSLEFVFQEFMKVNPQACQKKPDGKWVIEFPVQAPEGARLKEDFTAVEFLEMVRVTQQNWIVPGTNRESRVPGLRHNVSNTVSVRSGEWVEVADFLWHNRKEFTGVSMMPDTGDQIYAFAPFEAVKTEAQQRRWDDLVRLYTPVDYNTLMEAEDGTALNGEQACAGGSCER